MLYVNCNVVMDYLCISGNKHPNRTHMGTCTVHPTSPFTLLYILEYIFLICIGCQSILFLIIRISREMFSYKIMVHPGNHKLQKWYYLFNEIYFTVHILLVFTFFYRLPTAVPSLTSELPRQTRLKKFK